MIGGITVEYLPGPGALPALLDAVTAAGFMLRGLRVTPSFDRERAFLSLELDGCAQPSELARVERAIMSVEAARSVLHRAACQF